MALELIRINTAGMTPEQLYDATEQKMSNLVQQLNMKLLMFDDQDMNIIETRKTILTIEQAQSEFDQVITNSIAAIDGNIYKIHGELADYKKVVAGELTAVDGYIETLRGDFAKFKVGEFEALKTKALTAETADIRYASIDNLTAAEAEITKVSGELAEYKTVVATDIDAVNAQFSSLNTEYAQIDLANIKDGCITTAMIGTGVVDTAQIADGSITDAKIVALTANKITAGKLDAAEIEVINLNCANLTVGTINGQQIAPGAVDLSKLSTELSGTIVGTAEDVRSALTDAGLAINKANDATTAASTAQSTANTAKNNAATAQTAAENAQKTANAAAAAASSAQTTANGKNTVFYQTSAPATTGRKVNDIWFDTDDGNKMYCWSGTAWTAKQFSTSAIAANAVTANLITAGAITAVKLAVNAVTADKIYAGAVTVDKIAAGAVETDKLKANAVTAAKIAVGTITAGCLAANSITADKINANAVISAKIAANAITSDKIVADAITTAKIAAGAVTATEIATNAVIAAKISAGAVNADKIATGAITAAKIAAGAVTADKISVASLQAISAKIGGFNIGSTYLANNTTALAGAANSVYLGTNGISCGQLFKVTNKGDLDARSIFSMDPGSGSFMEFNNYGFSTGLEEVIGTSKNMPVCITMRHDKAKQDGSIYICNEYGDIDMYGSEGVYINSVDMTLDQATIDLWTKILGGGALNLRGILKTIANNYVVVDRGTTASLSTAAGKVKDVAVKFTKKFTKIPTVVVGFNGSSASGTFGRCACSYKSSTITTTGFTVRVFNGDTTTREPSVNWIAVGI